MNDYPQETTKSCNSIPELGQISESFQIKIADINDYLRNIEACLDRIYSEPPVPSDPIDGKREAPNGFVNFLRHRMDDVDVVRFRLEQISRRLNTII